MSEDKNTELTQAEEAKVVGGNLPYEGEQTILSNAGIKEERPERLPEGGSTHKIS